MIPTDVHADGEVHETDISSLGPGVGVGVTVQLAAAAELALTTPSESAAHAPATRLLRARAVERHDRPLRTTPITPRTDAGGQRPTAKHQHHDKPAAKTP